MPGRDTGSKSILSTFGVGPGLVAQWIRETTHGLPYGRASLETSFGRLEIADLDASESAAVTPEILVGNEITLHIEVHRMIRDP